MPRPIHVASILALLVAAPCPADVVMLEPVKDNTLFLTEEPTSNGAGDSMFCGRTGNGISQRAVLEFDVASAIPSGSVIDGVTLTVTVFMTRSGAQTHTLHRLTKEWGEGDSVSFGGAGAPAEPDDATWLHTFFPDAFWDNGGGDFLPTPRASATVGSAGTTTTWGSTADMVADVQEWIQQPDRNHGWLIRGNEQQLMTAKKIGSRETINPDGRPQLEVTFTPPTVCEGDLTGDGQVTFADLLAVLAAWGPCGGCPEDFDNSGIVDFEDLLVVLGNWGPCP